MLQNRRYNELMSAKSVPPVPLGPWAGVDNTRSPAHRVFQQPDPQENRLPFLRAAVNVDIDDDGWATTRDNWEQIDSSPSHSLFEHAGSTYAVVGGAVAELTETGIQTVGSAAGPVAWTILNGKPVFTDGVSIMVITDGGAAELPSSETEEDEGLDLDLLPPGNAITYWRGRLLTGKGSTLYFSEPMRYGVYDTIRGQLFFEQPIEWLVAVNTGLYVGLEDTVRFLRGVEPFSLEQSIVAGRSTGGRLISTTGLQRQEVEGAPEIAVWFGDRGFALGLESGRVIYPQQDNIRDLPVIRGQISFYNDRLTAIFD